MRSMYIEPIKANCRRYSGLQSVLAPMSITKHTPSLVGKMPPSAGRSTPGTRFSVKSEAAIIAPLLPAETAPNAAPSRTCWSASVIEAFFLRLTAIAGCSSISIASSVWMMGRSRPCVSCLASSARITFSFPTRKTPIPYSRAACTAPSIISPGALSPPIASSATRPDVGATLAEPCPGDRYGLFNSVPLSGIGNIPSAVGALSSSVPSGVGWLISYSPPVHQSSSSLAPPAYQDRRVCRRNGLHRPDEIPAPHLPHPVMRSRQLLESGDQRPLPSTSIHLVHSGKASSDQAKRDQVDVRVQRHRNASSVSSCTFRSLHLPMPLSAARQWLDHHP